MDKSISQNDVSLDKKQHSDRRSCKAQVVCAKKLIEIFKLDGKFIVGGQIGIHEKRSIKNNASAITTSRERGFVSPLDEASRQ